MAFGKHLSDSLHRICHIQGGFLDLASFPVGYFKKLFNDRLCLGARKYDHEIRLNYTNCKNDTLYSERGNFILENENNIKIITEIVKEVWGLENRIQESKWLGELHVNLSEFIANTRINDSFTQLTEMACDHLDITYHDEVFVLLLTSYIEVLKLLNIC